jgi:hypothetical protein
MMHTHDRESRLGVGALAVGLWVAGGFLLGLLLAPAAAQLVVYDDFAAGALSGDRWRGGRGGGNILEIERSITPEGQLFKRVRLEGRNNEDIGITFGDHQLVFTSEGFPYLQFDLTVAGANLQPCPVAGSGVSLGYVQASMRLFNDGTSTGPGDQTGDIAAWIQVERTTAFAANPATADPAIFEALASVFRCVTPTCTHEVLSRTSLGLVLVGQPNTFSIRWDAFSNMIIFQRNADPPVAVPNAHPVVAPRGERLLGVTGGAANCTAPPRPVADLLVLIDNVVVFFP